MRRASVVPRAGWQLLRAGGDSARGRRGVCSPHGSRASSSSIIWINRSRGCAPTSGRPLMKKVGVALTPTRLPSSTSRCTTARSVPPGQALFEGPNVQPDRLSMRLQLLRNTFPRAGIKRVVIGPELPLVIRAPSGLVRQRLPVRRIDREVPMDELHLAAVPGQELGESRLGPLAEGAVEVLELDDRHR